MKTLLTVLVMLCSLSGAIEAGQNAGGQAPAPAPTPAPASIPAPAPAPAPAPTPAPARANQGAGVGVSPKNIRFDIAISDAGTGAPITKMVTLNVSQGGNASIRSTAPVPGTVPPPPRTVSTRTVDGKSETTTTQANAPSISLNVDVSNPLIYEDGNIRAIVVIEYQPFAAGAGPRAQPAVVRANSMSVFENGRKTVLLQAADPLSDRRTTIEVTATVAR